MYDPNKKCPNCGGYLSDREFPQFNKVQRKCLSCGETYYEKLEEENANSTNTNKVKT